MSFIEINGSRSTDLGLKLLRGFDRTSAENDVSEIKVLGKDGVLTVNNNRKEPVIRDYDFTVYDKNELVNVEERLSKWLDFVDFKECTLGWDEDHVYLGKLNKPFNPKELFARFSVLTLQFKFQPYKFIKQGMQMIDITGGKTLMNIGSHESLPLIKLTGTATSMIISINGRRTEFKDVQSGIVIDSLYRSVYWDTQQKWRNFVRLSNDDFPRLNVGNNTITVTGATKAEMIPRWVVKL